MIKHLKSKAPPRQLLASEEAQPGGRAHTCSSSSIMASIAEHLGHDKASTVPGERDQIGGIARWL